ncbi:MAG: hypothetical protein RSB59_02350 [Clostridia bacterium]
MKTSKHSKSKIAIVAAVLALSLTLAMTLVGCNDDGGKGGGTAASKPQSYVTVDINPSVELVLDQNQTVVAVEAGNTDAEVMLYNADGILGVNVNVAVENIAKLAVEMKYIDDSNKNISVTVSSETTAKADEIYNSVKQKMEATLSLQNVQAQVVKAVDIVLEKELASVKAKNTGKVGYDDSLTVEKYRLVKSALRADRMLTMDEAVKLTSPQLTAIVKNATDIAKDKFGKMYKLALQEAQFAYDEVKQVALDSAYYTAIGSDLNLIKPVSNYVGCRSAYRTISHIYDSIHEQFLNPIISEEDALNMLHAVGINVTAISDILKQITVDGTENGEISKDSFSSYLNKVYRNMPAEKQEAVSNAYGAVQAKLDEIGASVSVTTANERTAIKAAIGILNLDVEVSYDTVLDVNIILEALQKAIDTSFAKMDSLMTSEQKARVAEIQKNMSEDMAAAEKTFADTVTKAQQDAEAWLKQMQDARKAKA